MLVVGCWLLVVGYWLLVVGCWLLVVGYWLLVISGARSLAPYGGAGSHQLLVIGRGKERPYKPNAQNTDY